MSEKWKDIKGYEGLYQVSNLGRVKSLGRETLSKRGVLMKFKGRMLSLNSKDKDGYILVSLVRNKQKTTSKVHRLVCEAFLPNPENRPQVNHKNGIKNDNRLDNLEWCTSSENQLHSIHTLSKKILKGEEIGHNVLNENLIFKILEKKREGYSYTELENMFGINRSTIHSAFKYTWKHLNLGEIPNKKQKGKRGLECSTAYIPDETICEIYKKAHSKEYTQKEIGDMYGVPFQTVSAIKLLKMRKWTLIENGLVNDEE